jgi:hypothetical protein
VAISPPRPSFHPRKIPAPDFFEKYFRAPLFARRTFFPSRKYLHISPAGRASRFSEEKSAPRANYFLRKPKHEAISCLSTKKVTGNFQNPPEFCLTGYGPISISCGQGSGHPHPVVVDNVLGSFGNLVSPGLFDRR